MTEKERRETELRQILFQVFHKEGEWTIEDQALKIEVLNTA